MSRNLTADEWRELRGLITKGVTGKSKRSPWKNLSQKQRERLRVLVREAIRGEEKRRAP